ncbi:MAG: CBS domain-containing protein [Lachnospiraceae bacterium]
MQNLNILFFLTPKSSIDMIYEDETVGQTLERMKCHEYTSYPMINGDTGKYIGTITQGDILREITTGDALLQKTLERPVGCIPRNRDYRPVRVNAEIWELFESAKTQNFIPVTDDSGVFIGIVTRKDILQALIDELQGRESKEVVRRVDRQRTRAV